MASIKRNLFYNLLMVVSNIAFPFIVFPYVSRVLGPVGIGESQFVLSFARYFTMIAAIGIPIYGVREITKVRNTPHELSKLFKELLWLSVVASVVCFGVYVLLIISVSQFQALITLSWIAGLQILLSFTAVEWFFYGNEQFKTIAIRSVLIKVISVVCVFGFVQTADDVPMYLLISVCGILGFQFWNLVDIIKKIGVNTNPLNLKQHLKPLLFIFATSVFTSVYTAFDTTLLGLMDNTEQVGFYATAIRIAKMGIPLVSSVSIVVIPRVVQSFMDDKRDDSYLQKSFAFIIDLSIPMMFGIFLLAPEWVLLLAGHQFEPAILALQLLSPLTLLVGLNNLFGTQVLASCGYERLLFYAVVIGTFVSLAISIVCIPLLHHIGSAIAMLVTETVVTLITYFWVRTKMNITFSMLKMVQVFLLCLPFVVIIYVVRMMELSLVFTLINSVLACVCWYSLFQVYGFKNKLWIGFMVRALQFAGIQKDATK